MTPYCTDALPTDGSCPIRLEFPAAEARRRAGDGTLDELVATTLNAVGLGDHPRRGRMHSGIVQSLCERMREPSPANATHLVVLVRPWEAGA